MKNLIDKLKLKRIFKRILKRIKKMRVKVNQGMIVQIKVLTDLWPAKKWRILLSSQMIKAKILKVKMRKVPNKLAQTNLRMTLNLLKKKMMKTNNKKVWVQIIL
jgi:hypothetical protein